MDPIQVVPVYETKYFDGTNVEEITTWLKTSVTDSIPGATEVWWMVDVEKIWLGHNQWILASMADPPRVAETLPDDLFRARYGIHPGAVIPVPPLSELLDDGPVTP